MHLRFLLPAFVLSVSALVGCSATAEDASTSASNFESGEENTGDLVPTNLLQLARGRWQENETAKGVHAGSVLVLQVDTRTPVYLEADKDQLAVLIPTVAAPLLSISSTTSDVAFAFASPTDGVEFVPDTYECAAHDSRVTITVATSVAGTLQSTDLHADAANCAYSIIKTESEPVPADQPDTVPYALHSGVIETDVVTDDGGETHHVRAAFIIVEGAPAPAPTTNGTNATTNGTATTTP